MCPTSSLIVICGTEEAGRIILSPGWGGGPTENWSRPGRQEVLLIWLLEPNLNDDNQS